MWVKQDDVGSMQTLSVMVVVIVSTLRGYRVIKELAVLGRVMQGRVGHNSGKCTDSAVRTPK
jgi:hypothetical protein